MSYLKDITPEFVNAFAFSGFELRPETKSKQDLVPPRSQHLVAILAKFYEILSTHHVDIFNINGLKQKHEN